MLNKDFVRLSDYKPYPFLIPSIELDFDIKGEEVFVNSLMQVIPIDKTSRNLELKGVDLDLQSISINGRSLKDSEYEFSSTELIFKDTLQEPFQLKTTCKIKPFENTSLQGLYSSGNILVTQCEAEGFRHITFHPDRPDVLSRFKVCIKANCSNYPILLSNGNQISSRLLDSCGERKEVIWEDPYPKPSYLFALVAGDLREVKADFKTSSGRSILLRVHVEEGDEKYTHHAVNSLKRAMKWDEEKNNLEYDLDEYNIVAVRHFNMGAMENKSLNIFNSKLVLADSEIATDSELERIESVIAHEYFHNWTGNRITCRDWFQLSLKEGLTVYRDQSFTADLHSPDVKRVEDVSLLRNTQFREDAGPTSHPVKPDKYHSIDNFYTTTIYEKGAEIIRMLNILIGKERFMKGFSLYIKRFDGTAATTEDFLSAIAEGACSDGSDLGFELDKFRRWYHQRGTPKVSVSRQWIQEEGKLTITLKQIIPQTEDKSSGYPLVIPFLFALIGDEGRIGEEQLMILDQEESTLVIEDNKLRNISPVISCFRGFSAPVVFSIDSTVEEYIRVLKFDDDHFARWEAGKNLMREAVLARASGEPEQELENELIKVLEKMIENHFNFDHSALSTLLTFPGMSELEISQDLVTPLSLYYATINLKQKFGRELQSPLKKMLAELNFISNENWPNGQGARRLTAIAWSLLTISGDQEIRDSALQAVSGSSMTLARGALNAFKPVDCPERTISMNIFYERWKDRPVILDSWFALESSIPHKDGLSNLSRLLHHPRFDPLAPNSIRAVLGGLASNPLVFHAIDGTGYTFMAEQLLLVDGRNPITASRIVKVFSSWNDFSSPHKEGMFKALKFLVQKNLSSNTREVVELMLNNA